jgi:hypothetical protein
MTPNALAQWHLLQAETAQRDLIWLRKRGQTSTHSRAARDLHLDAALTVIANCDCGIDKVRARMILRALG